MKRDGLELKTASIALVVIVKNEAARISAFLKHHKGLVDEIIVLDTGSSDNTASLAATAGAAVYHFEWCDDFSAARNAAMAYAKSDYALCIDADECIAVSDFSKLKAAAQQRKQCYLMPQRNYYGDPRHPEWQPVKGEYSEEEAEQSGFFEAQNTKFFDLHCGLQFNERVHESVIASAHRHQVPIVSLNVPIHHYGYVISEAHNQQRHARYFELLSKKYAEKPDDAKTLEEYATQLIQMGQGIKAMPLLQKLDTAKETNSHITRARLLLAQLKKAQGNNFEAESIFRRAVKKAPDYLFAHVHLLRHLVEEKKFRVMAPYLNDALARFGEQPPLLQVQSQYLIQTHQIHDAAKVTRKLARLFPQMTEYAQLAEKCEALSQKVGAMEKGAQ